ncbi:D-alanine--D-alanine ligase [Niallia sp. Krafla_26]|uniref:D-alanine--D-alanine ligase n=1 Tax=Niallia sp. Krafla_26 TaxID=3064703 RepID=UPI003D1863A1
MKTKLGLLYGGKSAEHQVSLRTALAVIQALDHDKFEIYPIYITETGAWVKGAQLEGNIQSTEELKLTSARDQAGEYLSSAILQTDDGKALDVIFPLLHGPNGEDGTVQGFLELLNIPYVGNGVLSSSAGMDKVIMKNIFAQAGLTQVNYVSYIKSDWNQNQQNVYDQVEEKIGYPCFVKPANLGSSVGISKCTTRNELDQAFQEAFQFDRKVIIEEGVIAREVEIAVLGNDDPKCSVAGEIIPKKDFYDYKAKYEDDNTVLVIPAEISAEEYENLRQMAITAFKSLDSSGLVRADFFLTKDGKAYINEVNTMPGFTPVSMFPLLWKHSGLSYPELIERLVQLGIERHKEKQSIKYTF